MKSIIIGAGSYGEVYLSYLREAGVEIIGFLDDNPALRGATTASGLPVAGAIADMAALKETLGIEAVYCPLGDNALRQRCLEQARSLGLATPNYIHPQAYISPDVSIADSGVYILGHSYVMPHAVIERDVMVSVGANIAHHTRLRRGVFISTGVNVGAGIDVMERAYVGISATLMTGLHTVGRDSLTGAGAVVIRDVPDGAVMAGVPARAIKFKPGFTSLNNNMLANGGVKPASPFPRLHESPLRHAA